MPHAIGDCKNYTKNQNVEHRISSYRYAGSRAKAKNPSRPERGYAVASHFAQVIAERRRDDCQTVDEMFHHEADLWWKETRVLSSIQAKIFNPHYQRIIGMGHSVLPLIFSQLRDRGGLWYWALECITGHNPASEAETLREAKSLWLEYAYNRQYL